MQGWVEAGGQAGWDGRVRETCATWVLNGSKELPGLQSALARQQHKVGGAAANKNRRAEANKNRCAPAHMAVCDLGYQELQ
jgi:hypothetical protein